MIDKLKKFMNQDVVKTTKKEVQQVVKPKKTNNSSARAAIKTASKLAGRALIGKAALVGGAAALGYHMGTNLEKETGIGKKIGGALYNIDQNAKRAAENQKKKNAEVKQKPVTTPPPPQTTPKKGVKDKVKQKVKINQTITPKSKPATPKVPATRIAFNKAFAAARKAGESTFTFRGKSYTTKMK